jgi:hypothetical protein
MERKRSLAALNMLDAELGEREAFSFEEGDDERDL